MAGIEIGSFHTTIPLLEVYGRMRGLNDWLGFCSAMFAAPDVFSEWASLTNDQGGMTNENRWYQSKRSAIRPATFWGNWAMNGVTDSGEG